MLTAAAACVLLATGCCSLAGAAALTASAGLSAAAATALPLLLLLVRLNLLVLFPGALPLRAREGGYSPNGHFHRDRPTNR